MRALHPSSGDAGALAAAASAVSGVLLCRVGEHRLAFPAQDVATVEPRGSEAFPVARRAFGLPDQAGRVLIANGGEAVMVDRLEVFQGQLPVLALPPAMRGQAGSSLAGFVLAREQLWPLLRLAAFSRFLDGLAPAPLHVDAIGARL